MPLKELLKNYHIKTGVDKLKELPAESTMLRKAKKNIKILFDPVVEPQPNDLNDLEKVIPEIINHFQKGKINNLSPSLKRKIPFCIWFKKNPLKKHMYIINDYYDDVIANPTKRSLWNLIYAYLLNYDLNDIDCKKIGNVILKVNSKINDQRISPLIDKYALFSLGEDTRNVSTFLKSYDETFENFLVDEFLVNQTVMQSKFMETVFRYVASDFKNNLNVKYIKKIIDIYKNEDVINYENQSIHMIESFLDPWINQKPSPEIKKFLEEYLIDEFGDLRNPDEENKWLQIKEVHKKIFRRWLAGAQIEFFVNIISDVAYMDQWQYRRKFWLSYYDENRIDDAYVILGKDAIDYINTKNHDNIINFGKFATGSRVRRDQSVLLLKINDLIIADWSHDGACRIWEESSKNHPEMFKDEYTRDELVENISFDPINHISSSYGTWQRRVASHIQNYTGIRMAPNKFMPQDHELE